MHQDRAARLELVLIHKRQDPDVVLGSDGRRDDGVVLIDELLKIPNAHGRASEIVDLGAVLLGLLLLGLEALLVAHELLLHQQIVLHALQLQQPELALRQRRHSRQPSRGFRALLLALLASHAGRRRRRLELLLLLVGAVVLAVAW